MKFYSHEKHAFLADAYLAHIKNIKDKLPESVYEYASDVRHYDLQSVQSLHDSWLEEFSVNEEFTGVRKEVRQTKVKLKLLGSFHDHHIYIEYNTVSNISMNSKQPSIEGWGDLLAHEFDYNDKEGCVTHEMQFAHAYVMIGFQEFKCLVQGV